jgi:hypothetical protein
MARIVSEHGGRQTFIIGGVHLRPVFDQRTHHLNAAVVGGHHQGCQARGVAGVYVCAPVQYVFQLINVAGRCDLP